MKTKEIRLESLKNLQLALGRDLEINEEAIIEAYEKNNDGQSITVKVLSIFGGILASIAFYASLIITGLYDSATGLLFAGIFCISGSVWLSRKFDKIIVDTLSVTSFIVGFVLLGLGLYDLKLNDDFISIIFIILASGALFISQNYILSFISVLIINVSLLTLIVSNREYNMIHLFLSAHAVLLTFFILEEAKIISTGKLVSKLYNPIRVGLLFSFLAGLILIGTTGMLPKSTNFLWISSVFIIAAIIYTLFELVKTLGISKTMHKVAIYACVILLLPTAYWPAIPGAILMMLLSFMVNFKTGFVISIAALIYFISQYYYDLEFTLLTKSILMFSSGLLFLGLYFIAHKKLMSNEQA